MTADPPMGQDRGAMSPEPGFEQGLEKLEAIVAKLESPDLSLEASLALFEEGMKLTRLLEKTLDDAERRIELLLRRPDGGERTVPFDPASER